MKPSNDPLAPHLVSSEICRLAADVATPANYFEGVGGLQENLPGKILCFTRRRASELVRPLHQKSYEHQRCVLLIAVRGSGQLCLDADHFTLDEGQTQFISPFQFHSYMEIEPEQICWIFITFEMLPGAELKALRSSASRSMGPTEMVLLREILRCWLEESRHALLPLHLGLLLGRLGAMGDPSPSLSPWSKHNSDSDLIARVNSYVLPRLDQPIRLKELARAIGDSESHLRAKFREGTGCSLGRHLRHLRLQKACRLLRTTELSITEIAERCGCESVYSFSRTFKTGCGISPRAYRQGVDGAKMIGLPR